MPIKKGKIFAQVSQNLEKMADGIDKHRDDVDFPINLKKLDLRGTRQKLENLSEEYEKLMTEARLAYDRYSDILKAIQKDLSNYKTMIEGFYGKKSNTLLDFGLKQWKTGEKKAKRKKE